MSVPVLFEERSAVVRVGISSAVPVIACHPQLSTPPEPIVIMPVRAGIRNQQQDGINIPSLFPVAQTYVRDAFI